MKTFQRVTKAYNNAKQIEFDKDLIKTLNTYFLAILIEEMEVTLMNLLKTRIYIYMLLIITTKMDLHM